MRRTVVVPAVLAGLGVSAVHAGPVDFQFVAESVQVDYQRRTATFTIQFNQQPDFSPGIGHPQRHAFQYEIDTDSWALPVDIPLRDINTIIRGSEIWLGLGIPIRDREGDGGPHAGGWGPVRNYVPYMLDGQTLSFTATFHDLGEEDGFFRYRLLLTDEGATTDRSVGAIIPLPTALWTGLTVLGGLGILHHLRRR